MNTKQPVERIKSRIKPYFVYVIKLSIYNFLLIWDERKYFFKSFKYSSYSGCVFRPVCIVNVDTWVDTSEVHVDLTNFLIFISFQFLLFLVFEGLLFALFTSIVFGTQVSAIWYDETSIKSLKKEEKSLKKDG